MHVLRRVVEVSGSRVRTDVSLVKQHSAVLLEKQKQSSGAWEREGDEPEPTPNTLEIGLYSSRRNWVTSPVQAEQNEHRYAECAVRMCTDTFFAVSL